MPALARYMLLQEVPEALAMEVPCKAFLPLPGVPMFVMDRHGISA